mgnify:CR=1 FL=1
MIRLEDRPVTRVVVRFKVRNTDWMPSEMLGQNFRSQLDKGIRIWSQTPLEKAFGENESVCLNSLPQILKDNGYKIVWFFHNSGTYDYLGFDFVSGLRKDESNCDSESLPFQIFADFCLEYWWKITICETELSVNDTPIGNKKTRALTIYCEDQIRSEENEGELARKLVIRPNNHQLDIETIAERNARQALMLVS